VNEQTNQSPREKLSRHSQTENQDITERKRAEAANQRSQAEVEAIYDSIPIMMCMVNSQAQIERMNRSMAEFVREISASETRRAPGDVLGCAQAIAAPKGCGSGDQCPFCHLRRTVVETFKTGQSCRQVEVELSLVRNGHCRKIQVLASTALVQLQEHSKVLVCLEDITQRKQAEVEIERLAAFPRLNPNPVMELSADGEIMLFNDASQMFAREMELKDLKQMLPPNTAAMVRECVADGTPRLRVEVRTGPRAVSWSFFPVTSTNTVHCYGSDITEEKRLLHDLLETSRMAGMAEVATSVLHNVGNVLNSVNISSSVISDKMRQSRIPNLGKAVALLREHQSDLPDFLTANGKGNQLLDYLHALAGHLTTEQMEMAGELALLTKNIDHIKEIVAMQQNYSNVFGICEMVLPADLVEDALSMNEASLNRHQIEVVRAYSKTPAVNVEKHKVLQILVNLMRNAQHACSVSKRTDRRLTVRVGLQGDKRVIITILDNGIGISAENLPRIFNHGFTTRRGGHGFGLHSGALAAQELGGALSVQSDGPGKGAEFRLELPLQRPQAASIKPAVPTSLDYAPCPGRNGSGHPVVEGDNTSPHFSQTTT
jgi:signal transduction histidine kinase